MNYFEILTQFCRTNTVDEQPPAFSASDEETYKKKQMIKDANAHIVQYTDWKFRNKKPSMPTVIGQKEYDLPLGTIQGVYLNGSKLAFIEDELLLQECSGKPSGYYVNREDNKIGFDKTPDSVYPIIVKYKTDNQAVTADGTQKLNLELETDTSIIPEQYQNIIVMYAELLYMRDKSTKNQTDAKANYRNRLTELMTYDRGTLEASPTIVM